MRYINPRFTYFTLLTMSCLPTSDKCDQFSDYSLAFWAQVPSDARRTNNGPESFHRHFNAQFTSPPRTFFIFWDAVVKQKTVTYVTMNDLNNLRGKLRLLLLLNAGYSYTPLPSLAQVSISTAAVLKTAVLARCRLHHSMLRYTICRRVLETFNDGGIALV